MPYLVWGDAEMAATLAELAKAGVVVCEPDPRDDLVRELEAEVARLRAELGERAT
jgi:hypothetical protein